VIGVRRPGPEAKQARRGWENVRRPSSASRHGSHGNDDAIAKTMSGEQCSERRTSAPHRSLSHANATEGLRAEIGGIYESCCIDARCSARQNASVRAVEVVGAANPIVTYTLTNHVRSGCSTDERWQLKVVLVQRGSAPSLKRPRPARDGARGLPTESAVLDKPDQKHGRWMTLIARVKRHPAFKALTSSMSHRRRTVPSFGAGWWRHTARARSGQYAITFKCSRVSANNAQLGTSGRHGHGYREHLRR